MADEEEKKGDASSEEETPKKNKGPIKLIGAVAGLIGTGTALALVAMPKKAPEKRLMGPAMHVFFTEEELVGNPLDDNFSRYLKFKPSCSFLAYDLGYPELRRADAHYETLLRESMQLTVSEFRIDDVMAGAKRDLFAAALEEICEPILFPVHIGQTQSPYDLDAKSGLRVGDGQEREGTFRGAFWENVLHVDGPQKTIQLGNGPIQEFTGSEYDLMVEAEDGTTLFVDVSALNDDFTGDVQVGVMGRIRRMFTGDIIAQ